MNNTHGIGTCDMKYFYDEIPSNFPDLWYQVHLQMADKILYVLSRRKKVKNITAEIDYLG